MTDLSVQSATPTSQAETRSASSPRPACSTATTPRSTSCAASCRRAAREVIHLGHNRSVDEVVNAALQEDVQGIAISSYQGGHVEYFKYMIDLLRERGGEHIKVFGGGGGVIVPAEIEELHDYGVARIYSPEDGAAHGPAGHDQRHARALRFATCAATLPGEPGRTVPRQRTRAGHASSPRWRTAPCRKASCSSSWTSARPSSDASRCSASPAPAARANPRSPTSWFAASASTSATS